MNLLGVEDRVLDQFLARVDPADADGMRRLPPLRRDQFDNFVFEATRWVVGEADMASFGYACQRYRYANNNNDMTALLRPVPLIPPEVTTTVAEYVAQCDRPRDGEPWVDGEWFSEREAGLRDQLYQAIGDDRGDGPKAAGLRAYSRMWSARIGDGFVHPAIGAHICSGVVLGIGDRAHDPAGGPHIAAIETIEILSRQWQDEPAKRPTIEREIVDLAHTLGW